LTRSCRLRRLTLSPANTRGPVVPDPVWVSGRSGGARTRAEHGIEPVRIHLVQDRSDGRRTRGSSPADLIGIATASVTSRR
jgi:hypothetical protein